MRYNNPWCLKGSVWNILFIWLNWIQNSAECTRFRLIHLPVGEFKSILGFHCNSYLNLGPQCASRLRYHSRDKIIYLSVLFIIMFMWNTLWLYDVFAWLHIMANVLLDSFSLAILCHVYIFCLSYGMWCLDDRLYTYAYRIL